MHTLYVKHGRVTSTYQHFVDVSRPLFQLYADVPVADFTPLALKAIRNTMVESGTGLPRFASAIALVSNS